MPSPSSAWTTAQVVEAFAAHALLKKYKDEVEAGEITGSDLTEMDEETVKELFGLGSKLVVRKVTTAIRTLVRSGVSAGDETKADQGSEVINDEDPTDKIKPKMDAAPTRHELPPGKVYGTFASHKKQHSVFGNESEVRGSS